MSTHPKNVESTFKFSIGSSGGRGHPPITVGASERRCGMYKKLVSVKSDRDLRGRARGRARRGSPGERAVHESGTVPARKECGGGIRGDTDLETWHSDARKWATEADVSSDPVILCRYELEEDVARSQRFRQKGGPSGPAMRRNFCLGMRRGRAATGG